MSNTDTTTETDAEAPVWAIVELMGHIRYGGRISKDNQFGTAMLRIEVPQKDGSFATQLINPNSLYRLTICTEDLARCAATSGRHEPMNRWDVRTLLEDSEASPPAGIIFASDDDGDDCPM